jgi:hypothetical protein
MHTILRGASTDTRGELSASNLITVELSRRTMFMYLMYVGVLAKPVAFLGLQVVNLPGRIIHDETKPLVNNWYCVK